MYDIIGDIHGHADRLEALLRALNYTRKGGGYHHPGRKALFVGDYIDRGPDNLRTVNLVRSMVDDGNAIALMGNHEYNALCYHTPSPDGGYLRPHSEKNTDQHSKTLAELAREPEHVAKEMVRWFAGLPLLHEDDYIRAVHACWDTEHVDRIREASPGATLAEEHLHASADPASPWFHAVETTLKGKETPLPAGFTFKDSDGHPRREVRYRWWQDTKADTLSFHRMLIKPFLPEELDIPPEQMDEALAAQPCTVDTSTTRVFPADKPVFFGHYWLRGQPALMNPYVCCLDYSVARDGKLAAYRYNGEPELRNSRFVAV